MSPFTFKAKHTPGDAVQIAALGLPGNVTMVRVDEGGNVDYFVVWWGDGKRCSEWLQSREIEGGGK